jgi:hypothetical protein
MKTKNISVLLLLVLMLALGVTTTALAVDVDNSTFSPQPKQVIQKFVAHYCDPVDYYSDLPNKIWWSEYHKGHDIVLTGWLYMVPASAEQLPWPRVGWRAVYEGWISGGN